MARKLKSDKWLFGAAFFLVCVSVVMVYSALAGKAMDATSISMQLIARQATWVALGAFLMVIVMRVPYHSWQHPTVINTAMGGVFAALFLLAVLKLAGAGHNVKGAVRWLGFGSVGIQPSEFAKLAVILFVARLLSERMERINDVRSVLVPVGTVLATMAALILYQPDLGTTVSIALIAFSMLFAAGLSLQYMGGVAMIVAPALYVLVWMVPFRRARVMAFLDPWADPLGSGFQIIQSLIAVGTGGYTGRGLMEGLQKVRFLPEPHTDFIYAVISEELGMVGSLAILLALLVIGWRGLRIAANAQDRFGTFLAVGLTTMMAVQGLINISVVLGLLPTKGLPLPFVSSGGSSMLVNLIGLGILLNVSQHASIDA
ncbi:cell division protein FtsW [Luteitalea sp. TBR-22]|uniref:putative lipid II flippase FtsW n=1 Tax=Luteitalea sp. TBR-22 TaxID=2802971 RepID=UPI001AF0B589|nr:putative lipid II flippase FtsW [Luteitalea sp. TBR-22]BCS35658.1 cell division protein FtsW [Luteitalea sp. TBR-22]